jgi:hypothetical protein
VSQERKRYKSVSDERIFERSRPQLTSRAFWSA